MSKGFLDNVSWQKVVLVLGGFILLIAAIVLFPEAFQRLVDTAKDFAAVARDFVAGGTP